MHDSESFIVDDDQKAEWALCKIKEHEDEAARIIAVCDGQIESYKRKIEKERCRCEEKTSYLRMQLYGYMQRVKTHETFTQYSYRLPSGKLIVRKPAFVYEHEDEGVIEYCKNNLPEFVVNRETLDWAGLKKRLKIVGKNAVDKETGEIVSGVKVVEKPGDYLIQFSKEDKEEEI